MSLTTTDKNITAEIASSIQKKLKGDALRDNALEAFKNLSLPASKNEEYKYTPITRLLEKNFKFDVEAKYVNTEATRYFIPNLDADVIVFVNGIFKKEFSKLTETKGISVLHMQDALSEKNAFAFQYFAQSVKQETAFTAWNTADWQHGVFIHVEENTVIERPIVIYHINNSSESEVVTNSRNLFVIGKNSEVTIIEKFDSEGASANFLNIVTEGFVKENAGLNLYTIQNDLGERYQHSHTEIHQERSSRVNTYTFTLQGKLFRNNLNLILDGEGIESHMYGLYLLDKDTIADNHTVADHKKPNSFSNELYKGVMDGSSRGVFNGKIYVRPQAQKTNAFQANRNISLSDKATVNTKPQLEIWADDVKCSHGCTTGQLDEEAVFYLQARGISKETARAMMLYAFAGEVLDSVKHPVLKEYFDNLISERLHKNF